MKQEIVVRSSAPFRGVQLVEKEGVRLALVVTLVCLALSTFIWASDTEKSTAIGTRTVEGLVRDIACPLQNRKSTATSYNKDCIAMCLKSGSPLGILTNDGTLYVPVTPSMPDTGQDALKPFVGEHVKATGKVYERNGARAIEITEIHALPKGAAGNGGH